MKKLQSFIDKYDIILFDMDGVITNERHYWNTSALVINDLFSSSKYFGDGEVDVEQAMQNRAAITGEIFCGDKTISLLKNKGVNSNWDIVYIVTCILLMLAKEGKNRDYEAVYKYVQILPDNALDIYTYIAGELMNATGKPMEYCERDGELWQMVVALFQEWYLGSERHPGMISQETPLFSVEELAEIFAALTASGKTLGYGTGRTAYEVETPVKRWGFERYFDKNRGVSYDTVVAGEKNLRELGCETTLTKPHPYVFLKGLYGLDYSDKKLIDGNYDRALIPKLLVVGDAGADILAAQAMDADFCAVLTGVSGQAARGYFEELGSTYILDSILNFFE